MQLVGACGKVLGTRLHYPVGSLGSPFHIKDFFGPFSSITYAPFLLFHIWCVYEIKQGMKQKALRFKKKFFLFCMWAFQLKGNTPNTGQIYKQVTAGQWRSQCQLAAFSGGTIIINIISRRICCAYLPKRWKHCYYRLFWM